MKKTLLYFGISTSFLALFTLCGCSKTESPVTPPPCTTCPCTTCPAAPTITASITTSNPAWYNGSASITYSTTGGDTVTINQMQLSALSGTVIFNNLKKDSVIELRVKGPGGTASKTLNLNVYSERRTLFCNYGPVHQVLVKVCNVDSVNIPSAWLIGPDDCNVYQFYADDSSQVVAGPCNPGFPGKSNWSFKNNESQILFSGYDLWTIDSLDSHGFQRSQIQPDPTFPSIVFIKIQKFSH